MKKSTLLLIVLFINVTLFSQVNFDEKGISFQGIARDASNNAITNTTVSVKFTIGTWSETVSVAADGFGVFSHTIGEGNEAFKNLDFINNDYNLKVEVNSNEIYFGPLNSVPYAKAAAIAQKAVNGVPPGSIMPYAGDVIPDGWLLCDGSAVSASEYPELYNSISTLWGGNATNFNLPDLRGMFLRGVNGDRSDSYADSDNSRTVGSNQGDLFKSHNHGGSTSEDGQHRHSWTEDYSTSEGGNGTVSILWDDQNFGDRTVNTDYAEDHDHTISSDGGAETRPKNAAVNYIIKY